VWARGLAPLQQRGGMSTRVISGFDGLAEEEEDDGVATINPMEEGDEGEDGAMKVAAGMRALGVDRRYNIQKVDLRGIKHAPWVADTCRACFYKPGPDPTSASRCRSATRAIRICKRWASGPPTTCCSISRAGCSA
jgi:hypothetical protein